MLTTSTCYISRPHESYKGTNSIDMGKIDALTFDSVEENMGGGEGFEVSEYPLWPPLMAFFQVSAASSIRPYPVPLAGVSIRIRGPRQGAAIFFF